MNQLWAPWRSTYVAADPKPKGDVCFICHGISENTDKENLIAIRSEHSAVFLNRYPYNNGHLLIVPKSHKAKLDELTEIESADLQKLIGRCISAIDAIMKPDGYNVGLNLGRVAGAGVPGHLHWHLVPRWNGDTNFMAVLGDTQIISQSLDQFYDLLTARLT